MEAKTLVLHKLLVVNDFINNAKPKRRNVIAGNKKQAEKKIDDFKASGIPFRVKKVEVVRRTTEIKIRILNKLGGTVDFMEDDLG